MNDLAMITVYGQRVPAYEYESFKRMVDVLVGKSSIDSDIKIARNLACQITRDAFEKMKKL